MTKKAMAIAAVEALRERYPDAVCSLTYTDPLQLLIATRLSAQCTDARVNLVTPALFERYPTLDAFADASPEEVGEYIRSCGLYKTRPGTSWPWRGCCGTCITERFPRRWRSSSSCRGWDGKPPISCAAIFSTSPAWWWRTPTGIRISNRLGLCDTKDPYKVEQQLKKLLPPEESNSFCHRLVLFGRDVCPARSPHCESCPLKGSCPSFKTSAQT